MSFQLIDMDSYPRREHYDAFLRLNLTYSATISFDVTRLRQELKARGLKAYPAQIWMLTKAANIVPEFRMSRDEEGRLRVWHSLSPLYTSLHGPSATFSGIWTPFSDDFGRFAADCQRDIAQFTTGAYLPQPNVPDNVLNISSIPWVQFTGFNLNMPTDYLLPILTIGKYIEEEGRTLMPLAIQVHHAVCDGFHLGQFVEHVQRLADGAPGWLP